LRIGTYTLEEGIIITRDKEGIRRYEVKKVERGRVESSAIPGFFIEVDWLFSELLPPADKCLQMILRGEL